MLCAWSIVSASEPVMVGANAKQPRVAVAGQTISIAYAAGEKIEVATSSDGGASFASPIVVGAVPGLMAGMRRGPQLAMTGASIAVAGIGSQDGNIVAWRSRDLGKTWSGPVTVNDRAKAAREGLFSIAAGKGDTVWAVWLDLREPGSQIEMSASSDGGAKWMANRSVYKAPAGSVCECCQPTMAADAGGALAVMWRNHVGEARDMWITTSANGGSSFATPLKLGSGTWNINACPMDGGGVAVAGKAVQTVWRRDATMFAAKPGDAQETNLGSGKNGCVAVQGDTVYRAWQDGETITLKVGEQKPQVVGTGGYPHLATGTDGKGPVMLAWEAGGRVATLRVDR